METLRLKVDPRGPEPEIIARAAQALRQGGLVAFPTETVYGLGAETLNEAAVRRIFAAKERPAWDPLIVHIYGPEMLAEVAASVPVVFGKLCPHFMPGPLTVLLPKSPRVPGIVTAGRDKVAVRMPRHPVAQALLRAAGAPIAAPSANRFSRPSPTSAEHVLEDLSGRIEMVLDAGTTEVGVESTVLDITASPPLLLRRGGVSKEELEEALGCEVDVYQHLAGDAEPESLPSPGVGIRHYAPRATVVLVEPTDAAMAKAVIEHPSTNLGVLLPSGWRIERGTAFDWGRWGAWEKLASRLFAGLRWLDSQRVDVILAPLPPDEGLAAAIRERLLKSAK